MCFDLVHQGLKFQFLTLTDLTFLDMHLELDFHPFPIEILLGFVQGLKVTKMTSQRAIVNMVEYLGLER